MNQFNDTKLLEFITDLQLIPERTLELAFADSKSSGSFYWSLLEKGLVPDDQLGKIIAEIYSIQLIQLNQVSIPENVLRLIPEIVAKKQYAISFKKDSKGLHVAMSHPENVIFRDFLSKRAGATVIPYYATPRDIEKAFLLITKILKSHLTTS